MSDLVAFLKAQMDEDEAAANAAWGVEWDWRYIAQPFGERPSIAHTVHIARHDPARVLRDVEADRKLLAIYAEVADMDRDDPEPEYAYGRAVGLGEAVRLRAARFSDHPDYRQEWKP